MEEGIEPGLNLRQGWEPGERRLGDWVEVKWTVCE